MSIDHKKEREERFDVRFLAYTDMGKTQADYIGANVRPENIKQFLETEIHLAEERAMGEIIKEFFSLKMCDPMGYGNSKVEVSDMEEIVEKYGYSKEKILSLLTPIK